MSESVRDTGYTLHDLIIKSILYHSFKPKWWNCNSGLPDLTLLCVNYDLTCDDLPHCAKQSIPNPDENCTYHVTQGLYSSATNLCHSRSGCRRPSSSSSTASSLCSWCCSWPGAPSAVSEGSVQLGSEDRRTGDLQM